MRKIGPAVVFAVLLSSLAAATPVEIIDRILAVVDGAIIMQSDVTLALRLSMVAAPAAGDPVPAVLDALIERRLILEEVDRYAPPDPPDADIDRRLLEIRTRAGARFDTVLVESGLSVEQLRRQLRDDLRIESYLQQRFGAMQPSDDEIAQYYRDHQAAFMRDGNIAPLDAVREAAKAAVIADRRGATIRDWTTGLRRRANVNVLPR